MIAAFITSKISQCMHISCMRHHSCTLHFVGKRVSLGFALGDSNRSSPSWSYGIDRIISACCVWQELRRSLMMSLLTMVGSKIPHRLFDPWTPCLQQLLKVTTPPSHHGHRRFPPLLVDGEAGADRTTTPAGSASSRVAAVLQASKSRKETAGQTLHQAMLALGPPGSMSPEELSRELLFFAFSDAFWEGSRNQGVSERRSGDHCAEGAC